MAITFVFIPHASDPASGAWCKEICWRVHRTLLFHPWADTETKRVLRMPCQLSMEEELEKNQDDIEACQNNYRVYVQNIHTADEPDHLHLILIREPALDPEFFALPPRAEPPVDMVFWRMVIIILFVVLIAWMASVP